MSSSDGCRAKPANMLFLAPDENTWVGALRLLLEIPGARSLKDRRRAVAQIRERLRARGEVSVAEVGHLHDHDRAVVAVVFVSHSSREVRRALDRIAGEVETWGRARVLARDIRMFRPFDGHEDDSGQEELDEDFDESDIPDAPWAIPDNES